MDFSSFNFDPTLQEGLDTMGFTQPTPIQEKAIPIIIEDRDLIACAQTGTGKTAAFILPILNKISKSPVGKLNTLILAPTRELALQIDQQIQGFAYFLGISSIPVYGGGDGLVWEQQKRAMETGAEIIVATPGRLIALLAGGKMDLSTLQHLVLDEADRMMDMGFSDDILKIVNYLPKERQTVLFSATMPPKIRQFSMKILNNPEQISIAIGKTAEGVTQGMYSVYDAQKEDLVKYVLSKKNYEAVIIFASTKEKVKSLYRVLRKKFDVEAFHSDLEQIHREKIMSAFKNKKVKILVGTDIISRGIDVVGIELVINYDTPGDPEDYVHRVGRTARADKEGEALTFVNPRDQQKFDRIQDLIGMEVSQLFLPESMESGPRYVYGESKKQKKSGKKKGFSGKGGRGQNSYNGKKRFPPRQKDNRKKEERSESKQGKYKPIQGNSKKNNSSKESERSSKPTSPKGKFGERKNVID